MRALCARCGGWRLLCARRRDGLYLQDSSTLPSVFSVAQGGDAGMTEEERAQRLQVRRRRSLRVWARVRAEACVRG